MRIVFKRSIWTFYGPPHHPCGLRLLLVLSLAPRVSFRNSNSIWNAQTFKREFVRTPKCCVGILITITFSLPPLPHPARLSPSITGHLSIRHFTFPIMHLIPHPPTPTLPPPPLPLKFCITSVFHFSLVLQPSQEKLKTLLMQNFLGERRCIMGKVEVASASIIQHGQFHPTANNCCSIKKLSFSFV